MTNSNPLFRFKARVAETDLTGHCKTYWDRALSVSVLAETRDEAYKKTYKMMGELGEGSAWSVQIDSADEVMPEPPAALEQKSETAPDVERINAAKERQDVERFTGNKETSHDNQ